MLPIVEAVDIALVEEVRQLAPGAELAVFRQQLFHELGDPLLAVIVASVRDEEVVFVRGTWHLLTPSRCH